MNCTYLLPEELLLKSSGEILGCRLRGNHPGDEHLVQLSDRRFVLWQPQGIRCTEHKEYCECFSYREIEAIIAKKIIERYGEVSAHSTR